MFLKSRLLAALVTLGLFAGGCATTQTAAPPPAENATPAAQPEKPLPPEKDPTALGAALVDLDASAEGFKAQFPGQVTPDRRTAKTPSGAEVKNSTWAIRLDGVIYTLIVTDNPEQKVTPASAEKFLQSAMEGMIKPLNGTIESQEKIQLQGFPGLAYVGTLPQGKMKARNYVVDTRLYTLLVISPEEYAPGGDRFLASLSLVNPPPAPEAAPAKPAEPAAPAKPAEPAAPAPAPSSDAKSP